MPTTPLREGWFLEPRESSGNSRLFLGGVSRIMPKDELDTRVRDVSRKGLAVSAA